MKKILFIFITLIGLIPVRADDSGSIFYFSNLTPKDGLSQLSVIDICEDAKGFMWFATRNGLNRFDGESFVIYRHDPRDPYSLTDNHITVLKEDKINNGLWIGTNNGLNYLDFATNTITPYHTSNHPDLAGSEITALALDNERRLWIGTRSGLSIYNFDSDTFEKVLLQGELVNEAITALYVDKEKDQLLIGTHSKGLYVCDNQQNVVTHLTETSTPSLTSNAVSAIFPDSQKQFWIGTANKGINKWDAVKNSTHHFTRDNSGLTDNNIRCFEELNSKLIIGTFNGLSILDLYADTISPYNNFNIREGNLSHFSVYSLFIDKVGTLWVGTYSGGVNYYNPQNNRFTFYHPQNSADELFGIFGTMIYHPDGTLWMATEGGGLLEFNPDKKTFRNYLMEDSPRRSHNNNIIKSLMCDGDYIWCGTNKGAIYKFHIKTKRFSLHYQFRPEGNLGIYSIFPDKQQNLWIGTTAENGLYKLSPNKEITNLFPLKNEDKREIGFSSIRSFLELREGVYLIGTRSSGLFKYDTNTQTVVSYNTREISDSRRLGNNYVSTISRMGNGDIWIGTFGSGMYLFKEEEGIIKNLNTTTGLIDDNVCAIVEGVDNIWISAGTGISELNPNNLQFRNYNYFNGIEVREFTPQGGICLPNGDIYFSGSNGFLSFNNRTLTKNKYIPSIVFTRLSVNNKTIEPRFDDSGILENTIEDTKQLTLKYNQNHFSIAYCALNYIFHQQNQYAYRLLGNEREWNYVGTRKEAYYTNIPPGEYTFQVIAANNDGLWNQEGRSISIKILPPWWRTPLAYTLYTLITLSIILTIGYNIYIRQKLKQDLRIKQIEKQTLEDFHHTKNRLFTNFSHELRTPLTLVISPLEELLQQGDLSNTLKQKLQLITKNARRLLLLVNQLMDLQKNETGHMKLHVNEEDLNTFLREIYYAFKQISESKQVEFTYQALQEEVTAYFDHDLLEKVVFNLLSNAFKFTSANESVALSLSVIQVEKLEDEFHHLYNEENAGNYNTGNYFIIRVSDTGKGIPDKEKQHIFTPFYQANNNDANAGEGTGIGLSLTHSIVQLHHGIIDVKTNIPKGTIFTVAIPTDKSAYSEEELMTVEEGFTDHTEHQEITHPILSQPSSKTVLIVEDNEEIRQYMKQYLSNYYQILEAENGIEAFDIILQRFPDIVISDIMMPERDGLELCSLIKNDLHTSHIPVILITARTMVMHIKEGFISGADDYIVKPFSPEMLLIRINNLLNLRDKLKETYGKKFSLESMGIDTTSADERFMQKFFEIVEKYISDPDLNVELICKEIGFSRANFYRKLKAITNLSPAELIKNKRLEIAIRMLNETQMNISEISMHTGFSTPAYFAKCFRVAYGVSPTEYMKETKNK